MQGCSASPSIVNELIGESAFALQGPLGIDSGPSSCFVETIPLHEPLELLFWLTIHHPDFAAKALKACFKQQWNHQHDCVGVL